MSHKTLSPWLHHFVISEDTSSTQNSWVQLVHYKTGIHHMMLVISICMFETQTHSVSLTTAQFMRALNPCHANRYRTYVQKNHNEKKISSEPFYSSTLELVLK